MAVDLDAVRGMIAHARSESKLHVLTIDVADQLVSEAESLRKQVQDLTVKLVGSIDSAIVAENPELTGPVIEGLRRELAAAESTIKALEVERDRLAKDRELLGRDRFNPMDGV